MDSILKEPLRVFLVEDSEDDAFFLERSLRGSGVPYLLERARNGNEAIVYLDQFPQESPKGEDEPTVIFLDLKMPGISGFQVLKWIRDKKDPDRWRVIILSGSDQAIDIQRALKMGASTYIVKPPTIKDIQECLLPSDLSGKQMGSSEG